eukprot:CAMPEP_0170597456 /NCGR_PEP_ID=MMETSP0224-20130122/15718_1 /TAXON_ID=285029 /ORGANISM="Togula jolla, Strain CCCM 725" /LENGTH=330 /DNA_ID=CAMNT_0010921931 /DNA_START=82 /DNA_END=1074 /DNA_ORIENTATION=+
MRPDPSFCMDESDGAFDALEGMADMINGDIRVAGAGCAAVDGVYRIMGVFGAFPLWAQVGGAFELWRNSSHGRGWEWRIGKKNDYYYVNASNTETPLQGTWTCATGPCSNRDASGPPPSLTTAWLDELAGAKEEIERLQRRLEELQAGLTAERPAKGPQETRLLQFQRALQSPAQALPQDFPQITYDEEGFRVVQIQALGVKHNGVVLEPIPNGATVMLHRQKMPGSEELRKELTIYFDVTDGHFDLVEDRKRLEDGLLFIYFKKKRANPPSNLLKPKQPLKLTLTLPVPSRHDWVKSCKGESDGELQSSGSGSDLCDLLTVHSREQLEL